MCPYNVDVINGTDGDDGAVCVFGRTDKIRGSRTDVGRTACCRGIEQNWTDII